MVDEIGRGEGVEKGGEDVVCDSGDVGDGVDGESDECAVFQ